MNRPSYRRLSAVPATLLCGLALAACGAGPARPAPSPGPAVPVPSVPAAELTARIERGTVAIAVRYTGTVLAPVGASREYRPISGRLTVTASCSGFFVSAGGHVATARHCLEPGEPVRQAMVRHVADSWVRTGMVTADQARRFLPHWQERWRVNGPDGGAGPRRTAVQVTQPAGVPDPALTGWRDAEVLPAAPDPGNRALLKVENVTAQPLPLAGAAPAPGTPVVFAGFRAAAGGVAPRADSRSGTAGSPSGPAGPATVQLGSDMAAGMSGGPTVTTDGMVVGVTTAGARGRSRVVVSDPGDTRQWLAAQGVPPVDAPPATGSAAPRPRGLRTIGVVAAVTAVLLAGAGSVALAFALRRRTPARPAPARAPRCPACGTGHFPGTAFCPPAAEKPAPA